tara:strand:+ start:378 stop:1154 length:777 start_codon:yes stop_codon:yes gene_type:complete
MLLNNKRGLIMGVANDRSIAWGIAKELSLHGAEIGFTYQNELFHERLKPLAKSINSSLLVKCDVSKNEDVKNVFNEVKKSWGNLDFVVHALAFSDKSELKGGYSETSKSNFIETLIISSFSFTEICREAVELMPEGGSILTLSYIGGQRTTPNYNVMGVAKAALEASVKYLSVDLGSKNIRVNCISAGPMKTLAGAAISGGRKVFRHTENNSPLKRNPSLSDVGKGSLYLISDLSSGVTGEIHYVDCGFNIIAIPNET